MTDAPQQPIIFQLIPHPVALWFLIGVGVWVLIPPSFKDLAAIPVYVLLMMLALLPVLWLRHIQNRDQKPSWFRHLSWTPFPIVAVLYIVIFSADYFDRHVQVNSTISTIVMVSWFCLMVLPAVAWSLVANAARMRHIEEADKGAARNVFIFFTVMLAFVVLLTTATTTDWRPVLSFWLGLFTILLVIFTLDSLGFTPKNLSRGWRRLSQQTRINILTIIGALALIIALIVFVRYPPDPQVANALLALLGFAFLMLLYQGFLYIKEWRTDQREQQADVELAQGTDLPERYSIGDDGQIVERKPQRKRSKKPHQR